MYRNFQGLEHAVARSQEIADTVDIELELGKRFFPIFQLAPEDESPEARLRQLCEDGLKDRYSDNPERCKDGVLSEEVQARLDRELGVINKLGFADYFLICWDFVHKARAMDIPSTVRGSGGGLSLIHI